jgi:3-hydroxyacyl-[acyl-carrier-protein] dehydratase
MLSDCYYSIQNERTEDDTTVFDVMLNPDCPVYQGHFPGMPVAPGVCNIQMIKECTERIAGKSLLLEYISQCKLTALMTPQQHPFVQVKIRLVENDGARFKVIAVIGRDEEEYVIFKGEFTLKNRK